MAYRENNTNTIEGKKHKFDRFMSSAFNLLNNLNN